MSTGWLSRPMTWLRTAHASIDEQAARHAHVVMRTSDGSAGFVLFGGFAARHRFATLYFPAGAPTRTSVVVHRAATADDCRSLLARYGLIVFCGNSAQPELASELLSLPYSVDMEIPTPTVFEGPAARWSRSAKNNIARVNRSGFGFDIMTGEGWVDDFYDRMFRPSMRHRHLAEASIESRRALTGYARASGSELLRILDGERCVAASVNRSTPAGYRLLKLGWLNGDDELLKRGVVAAMYWFNFKRAAALGHRRLLLGSVTPFLENGVLVHKAYWGARLSDDSRRFSEFHLLLEPSHPACRRFLQTNSAVTTGVNRESIVFSSRTPDDFDFSSEFLGDIKRWYVWRDRPVAVTDVTSEEVPQPLRPWVMLHQGPAAPSRGPRQSP